ncbi:hypothetical protein [Leifsonia shinshuensis]
MTDAAPPRTQYELVPGMTAYRMNAIMARLLIGVYVVSGACVVWYAFGIAAGTASDRLPLFVIVVALPLAWGIANFLLVQRRDAAENAAGYTTRAGVLHQYDQVDPVSGVVIRRAGSAVLTKPERRSRDGAGSPGPSAGAVLNGGSTGDLRFEETAPAKSRLLLVVLGVVVVLLVFGIPIVVTASKGGDVGFPIVVVLPVLAFVAVVVALNFGGLALRARVRKNAVARIRPDAFVFLSRRTSELEDALEAWAGRYGTLPQTMAVSVGPAGVELWRRSADEPRVAFPWSAIDHVHPGRLLVPANRTEVSARTIHIFLGDGSRLDAPLPVYGAHGITFAGAGDANAVLDAFRRYTTVA